MVFDTRVDAKCCLCFWLPGALQPNQRCAGSSAGFGAPWRCSLVVLELKSLCGHHNPKSVDRLVFNTSL